MLYAAPQTSTSTVFISIFTLVSTKTVDLRFSEIDLFVCGDAGELITAYSDQTSPRSTAYR